MSDSVFLLANPNKHYLHEYRVTPHSIIVTWVSSVYLALVFKSLDDAVRVKNKLPTFQNLAFIKATRTKDGFKLKVRGHAPWLDHQ